jgi:hypothetical protein
MMRKLLLTIGPLVLGLCLVVAGFLYDVQYAGIPYQDPTGEQQAQYNYHSGIASRMVGVGVVLVLAGSLLLIYRLITSVRRRRSNKTWAQRF